MPVYRIPQDHVFPHPSQAEPDGLLGVGGDLDPRRLLLAYANGIFPWYNERQPILWFSPNPRFVLFPKDIRVGRSLRKRIRRGDYRVTLDRAFDQVIRGCKVACRPGQRGTWITRDMERAYNELHTMGFAHSVEAWHGSHLVGGLYGVSLGRLYAGESMFALEPDASKVGFVWLVAQLLRWGFDLVDCQVRTAHLERFGAVEIPRERYLHLLGERMRHPGRIGPWSFDEGLDPLEALGLQGETADTRSS